MNRRRTRAPETSLPPAADTLAVLDQLATRQYETKARTRRALEMPHRTLHDLLSMLESYARFPNLISRGVVDDVHRRIRRGLRLDDPKRFPPLPPARSS